MASNIPEKTEEIAKKIIAAAFCVHKNLGAGLLESTYEACLLYELTKIGLKHQKQVILPVNYDGLKIDAGYRVDILVEKLIIIELKAVDILTPLHTAQLLTYLKLSKIKLGFLINFNTPNLKDGIKRLIL